MIIFYTHTAKSKVIQVSQGCEASCATNCIKPKSKCCFKYKKKGINCKRCPKLFEAQMLKQVS